MMRKKFMVEIIGRGKSALATKLCADHVSYFSSVLIEFMLAEVLLRAMNED